MRWISFFLIIVLLSSSSFAAIYSEEADTIFSSKELTIEQKITGGVDISGVNKPLQWVTGTFNYYPVETYRQIVLNEQHSSSLKSKTDSEVIFEEKDVAFDVEFISIYEVLTKNKYKEIKTTIPFPMQNIPSNVSEYLSATDIIDITPEIKATASLIASGKDDLFEVSWDVAHWVVENVKYDLSSITEDYSQKASWVFKNKQGVCDELSILYVSMMRSLGVPARIAYGTSYSNSALFSDPWNAHAWTEIYFDEYGWVPFDLTYNQFGFIDASHIKFRDSVDVGKISSSYEWKGYDLNQASISIVPTEFDIRVTSAQGSVSEDFSFDASFLYPSVKIGSYNVLKLSLHNTHDHYISSLLQINVPLEVELIDGSLYPIFLKPDETLDYYILMKVDSSLSSGYEYTFPVSIYTTRGTRKDLSFKTASRFDVVSLNQINAYVNDVDISKSSSGDNVKVTCSVSDDVLYLEQNAEVLCQIDNVGNSYLQNGKFCLKSDELSLHYCENIDLTIGSSSLISHKVSSSVEGNFDVKATLDFSSFSRKEVIGVYVEDKPKITIADILLPESIIPGDLTTLKVTLNRASNALPLEIDLRVSINDNLFTWNVSSLEQPTTFNIPFNSYLFKQGDNSIQVFVLWEDSLGGQYYEEKSTSVNVDSFGFFDRFKSWLYRLMNNSEY